MVVGSTELGDSPGGGSESHELLASSQVPNTVSDMHIQDTQQGRPRYALAAESSWEARQEQRSGVW